MNDKINERFYASIWLILCTIGCNVMFNILIDTTNKFGIILATVFFILFLIIGTVSFFIIQDWAKLFMLTKKEIFEKVEKHLLKQNGKSLQNNSCAYRGDNGRKSSAGCLINDEFYQSHFEEQSRTNPEIIEALIKSGIDMKDMSIYYLVRRLQVIHDNYPVEEWKEQLDAIRNGGLFNVVKEWKKKE